MDQVSIPGRAKMKSDMRPEGLPSNSRLSVLKGAGTNQPILERHGEAVAVLILACLFIGLYFRLPRMGDIWWMDAPRHALNGAFVLDFIARMPFRHPVSFAYDYYRQWPALTILFYPPLFYLSLAFSYALFGVSEASALFVEFTWFFLLAWGSFRLSRYWLGISGSLAVSILLTAGHQLFFWGQQIMLDVPAYALVVWAAYFCLAYLKRGKASSLMIGVILAVLAVWTKYNAASFLVVFALAFLLTRGPRLLRERAVIQAAAVGALLFIPALVLFLTFGRYDLQQAYLPQHGLSSPFASFFFYAAIMPQIVSWPAVILAMVYVTVATVRPAYRIDRESTIFLIVWVVGTYVFYSTIAVKEPRHILMIGYPIVLAAVLAVDRTLRSYRWSGPTLLALCSAVLASTIWHVRIPYVSGMRQAAQVVARIAPHDTNVAIWCRYDGTFVFAMRAYADRRDLGVVRLDKILFGKVAVSFARGYVQRRLDAAQISQDLAALHVQYVVFQSGYMENVREVHQLEIALHSDKFTKVTAIPMHANYRFSPITVLNVYQLKAAVPQVRVSPHIQIQMLGGKTI